MGEVIVTIKIMPESPEVDMEELLSRVNEKCKVEREEIRPIAFGLKALIIHTIIQDEGGTDELEETLSSIPNVQSVEVTDVRRAL